VDIQPESDPAFGGIAASIDLHRQLELFRLLARLAGIDPLR
jgi:hypothetical protein